MDKIIGRKLDGRYELLEVIGTGGMADVYKATDVKEGTTVAVKILKKEFSENEEFLRRFRNESKAIAVLSHPNIVKILDVGFTNKIQFMVMEYIEGITLKEFIESEQVLDWKTAVFFTTQILNALKHAHERGIVHRDIKPQNVMLLNDGTIKVMDFGIAKFAREEGLTTTAQAIGSVHYISPEQARSDTTDEKSDIYSVGIVLYEMLTGTKPFDNTNPVSVALMHMQAKAKRPRTIRSDIPRGMEEIILKAIEKEPDDRYFSAGDMIADLEYFKQHPDRTFGYYEEEDDTMDREDMNNDYDYERTTKFSTPDEAAERRTGRQAAKPQRRVRVRYEEEADDEIIEEEYVEKRSMFLPILSGVVIVIVIMAVIFIFGLIINYFGGSSDNKEFPVPNFIGKDYNMVMREYGSKLQFKANYTNDSSQADTIISQSINEGINVKPSTKIEVQVSLGEKMIKVPPVDTSFTYDQAKSVLEDKGFTVVQKFEFSDDIKKDYVIKTVPEANTELRRGAQIEVYVSHGPMVTEVEIPDLTNLPEAEAKEKLEDADLTVKSIRVNSAKIQEGRVASQSLTPGSKVETKTEIIIYISTGLAENVTRTLEINFPDNVNGKFYFEAYIDGTLNVRTDEVDSSLTTRKTITMVSSGGNKQVVVKIFNTANGKSAEVCRYDMSFSDDQKKKMINDDIQKALEEVDGLKQNTPVVTHAPATQAPVTQAPATEPPATEAPVTEATEETEAPEEPEDSGEEE